MIAAASAIFTAVVLFVAGSLKGYIPGFGVLLNGQHAPPGYLVVQSVGPLGKAAGVRPQDRIPWRSFDLGARMIIAGERWGLPKYPVRFVVERGKEDHNITIIPNVLDPPPPIYILIGNLQLVVILVVLVAGTFLVLLRPTTVTWAWFLLSLWIAASWLGDLSIGPSMSFSFLPAWLHFAITEMFTVLQVAAMCALLVFAICFPDRQSRALARRVVRIVPYLFAALVIFYLTYDGLGMVCLSCVPFWFGRSITIIDTAIPALAIMYAAYAFWKSRGIERQKIQWVAVALMLAFIPYVIPYIEIVAWHSWHVATDNLDFANQWLELLYIGLPLAVAYTVIRHRVFNIKFVIGRAIALTILTALVVIVFALIDWVFVRKLEQTGLGVIAGIIAVTAIGFTAQAMHRRVDTFVDKTFFKRRHVAETRITQLARDIPSAGSAEALDAMLVKEPLSALQLSSAALFRRGHGEKFIREDAIGWPDESLHELDFGKAQFDYLAASRETQRIHWLDHDHNEFPSLDSYPVLALPIVNRDQLQAIALYGPHEDGVDFDPDEIKAINGLMIPAAAAYDHLEAAELRREAEAIRREAESLRNQQLVSNTDDDAVTPVSIPNAVVEPTNDGTTATERLSGE